MSSKFARRHYEDMAKIIRDKRADPRANDIFVRDLLDDVQEAMSVLFETDNPRFDRTRFNTACKS